MPTLIAEEIEIQKQPERVAATERLAPLETHRFAFVIHPLSVELIHRHQPFRWTRLLPDALVESLAAHRPPILLSRITGGHPRPRDRRWRATCSR